MKEFEAQTKRAQVLRRSLHGELQTKKVNKIMPIQDFDRQC